jgi:predicted XRE-type DNA-binding protein
MNHYVYYSYEEWGRGYIGVRSCKCTPEKDVKYFGSFTDKTFKPTEKIIIAKFNSRKEAERAEIDLHCFYEIHVNPHFANRVKMTTEGMNFLGQKLSEKAKQKLREFHTGFKHTEETKRKISKIQQGKKRPETGKPIELQNIKTNKIIKFSTQTEAVEKLGLHSGHISALFLGKIKTHGGYKLPETDLSIVGKKPITLQHLKTGKFYNFSSQKEACIALNLSSSRVSELFTGTRKQASGYVLATQS